ncbi:SusD/RagB family nutrient-binding outer membrane lipoprotein [Dyadobacter jiangsuensis]|uniref:SusD-like starch-binding protein associating with outer membrane n=1 Tax=Dyadobacter jiangsuensis TaxID=1591085 RepID=A0A2P8FPA3_9BACT|nr:SusD/RagB family nutrient-binding outer membrane lipoprotein [Dyadobacter jiangsuensis]PSL23561.1 SusD-like starch-binding protein associating with outer membrane [Dyadobacter jiangsuensis]
MKATFKYMLALALSLTFITGCDDGFDEINTNKVDPTSLAPSLILNKAIIATTYLDGVSTLGMLCYNFGIVQQVITPYGSSLSGGNYNQLNNSNSPLVWVNFYRNVIKQLVAVTEQTKGDPLNANIYHAARIWKAYAFMILTDTYGDIPYFDAGKGYISEEIRPKYDPQEAIYKDILKELEEASGALDASQPAVTTDILYGGNVARWKKLGYSLMLRAGMRLSKVDPTTAKAYVTKAVAGGLFENNTDNSIIRHTSLYNNFIANHLAAREKTNFYLAAPFVNYLKENNDPRLPVFAVRYVGAKGGPEQTPERASSDPKVQKGMPMGYNDVTINSVLAENGVVSLWDFTQINLTTVLKLDAPEFHITYAQVQLLLAEAAVRGWVTGEAADYYAKGIRANLEQMALYDPSATIKEDAILAYLKAHPLDAAKALEQINTQYWVATFLDGNESWANFRRSGFPTLKKNPYPGSEIKEDFIRRMPYPDSEIVVNLQNVNDANARQGPNDLNTRMWWDKK